ncbi:permease [Paenibacillus swuensis]|nr:permease [Paenibacillus swuensis]
MNPDLQNFKTIFLSIILEAFPFILLGVMVSALLQMFVSEETIRRLMPRNYILGIVVACLLGIIAPLCECGMIPVVRQLIRKGMPVYAGVTYILAAPIINPVVFASTSMAFRAEPDLVFARMGLAFVASAVIGLILYKTVRGNPLRAAPSGNAGVQHLHTDVHDPHHHHEHDGKHHHHDHHHHVHHHHHNHQKLAGRVSALLAHASGEFFDMGKYLMFGALLTALIQTLLSRELLTSWGSDVMGGHLFMMGFAYILSICSTSDAFVASSFGSLFTKGPLLTFLVFGPMLDLKTTLMLLSTFRVKFVMGLMALIIVVVGVGSLITELILWK